MLVYLVHNSHAQPDSITGAGYRKQRHMFSVALGVQHGFIFAHSEAVENTKGSHPTGAEVVVSWQRNDADVWDLCNCFPRKGLLMAYYDYDNKFLGKSITAAYFLEPVYKVSKNFFFSFKGSAGLSYLTNPFDSVKNPSNLSYSTPVSAYLLVGLGGWFRLHKHWWLNASVNYQHESNGGLRQPNKGINWPTAGIAISYQKNDRPYYTGVRSSEKFWLDRSLRWDISLFGMARRVANEDGKRTRMPLIGASFQVSKQVGRIHALIAAIDVYRDAELRYRLKQDSIQASSVKAGLSAGHEFILGKFLFSQRLGIYVFDQTPYYDLLYHRWGLNYRINNRLGIGFNLQAHRHVADFVDIRLTYSLQKRKE